jgi:hypothetical protein
LQELSFKLPEKLQIITQNRTSKYSIQGMLFYYYPFTAK